MHISHRKLSSLQVNESVGPIMTWNLRHPMGLRHPVWSLHRVQQIRQDIYLHILFSHFAKCLSKRHTYTPSFKYDKRYTCTYSYSQKSVCRCVFLKDTLQSVRRVCAGVSLVICVGLDLSCLLVLSSELTWQNVYPFGCSYRITGRHSKKSELWSFDIVNWVQGSKDP